MKNLMFLFPPEQPSHPAIYLQRTFVSETNTFQAINIVINFRNVLNTLQPIISKFIDQKGCNAMFLPQNLFWVQKYLRIEEYPQPPLQTKSRTRHGSMPSGMY